MYLFHFQTFVIEEIVGFPEKRINLDLGDEIFYTKLFPYMFFSEVFVKFLQ